MDEGARKLWSCACGLKRGLDSEHPVANRQMTCGRRERAGHCVRVGIVCRSLVCLSLVCLSLVCAGCEKVASAPPNDVINDDFVGSIGRLAGVVTRMNGAPAVALTLTAQIHGVVESGATTDTAGAFRMTITSGLPQSLPTDTLLTIFVNARTTVGAVNDSLVLRESVALRMSRNIVSPPVTSAQFRAAY
jgi:hypothetical protein